MSPFRAARSSRRDAARRTSSDAPGAFAFFMAVRSSERCARLRTAAACDLRRFFSAESILGTNDLQNSSENGAFAGVFARPEPTHPEWRMSRQDFDFARVEQYLF